MRSREGAIATLARTDGVVPQTETLPKCTLKNIGSGTTPSAPPRMLSRNFLVVAATPPNLRVLQNEISEIEFMQFQCC